MENVEKHRILPRSRLKPTECPIIHSDQGVLYGSAEWGKMLEGKAVQSMSRRGNCYDNAVIESFLRY